MKCDLLCNQPDGNEIDKKNELTCTFHKYLQTLLYDVLSSKLYDLD